MPSARRIRPSGTRIADHCDDGTHEPATHGIRHAFSRALRCHRGSPEDIGDVQTPARRRDPRANTQSITPDRDRRVASSSRAPRPLAASRRDGGARGYGILGRCRRGVQARGVDLGAHAARPRQDVHRAESLPPGASGSIITCAFSVNLTAVGAGTMDNVTGAITSNEGGTGGVASARLIVTAAPASTTPVPVLEGRALAFLVLVVLLAGMLLAARRSR